MIRVLLLLAIGCAPKSGPTGAPAAPPTGPPIAEQRPVERTQHGHTRVDPWAWLADRDDPAVRAHLEAEAAWAEHQTRHLAPLRKTLLDDATNRHPAEVVEEVRRYPGTTWKSLLPADAEHPVIVRCPTKELCNEVLDVGALAAEHPHLHLGGWYPSPDHAALAWLIDLDGDGAYDLHLDKPADRVPEVAEGGHWSADGAWVFYVVYDEAWRPWRVLRHRVGTPVAEDVLVYEEADERFHLSLRAQGGQLWIEAASATTDEVLRLPLDQPTTAPQVIWPRRDGVRYRPVLRGDTLWIVTDLDEPAGRVLSAPLASPSDWTEAAVPTYGDQDAVERVDALAGGLVLTVRLSGQPKLVYHALDGTNAAPTPWAPWPVPFDLEHVEQGGLDDRLIVAASSWTHHRTLLELDARGLRPLDTGWSADPTLGVKYVHTQRTVRARDGVTDIPVTLLYRQDTPLDGTAPLFLTAYGAYGSTWGLEYEDLYLSLADRGVVVARAHVRGGGDRGPTWHDGGRMGSKQQSFTDTIDVARGLSDGMVDPDRMALYGLSAGGLLVGAVINAEPGLFRAVVAEVPFVDVLTTMSDPDIPLTVIEWEEWGNPAVAEQHGWMAAYSPYDNVVAADYPALLVTTAWNDTQVGYWEPAKWVQRVRQMRTDGEATLLKVDFEGGHDGTPGRFGYAGDQAWVMAWVLEALGVG